MNYNIKGIEIKSENAARSPLQPSRSLENWLSNMDAVEDALDYGCGKLRYADSLSKKSKTLTLVDSKIQLERIQTINREKTSVKSLAQKKWPSVNVLTIEEFEEKQLKFDFILCANVLSAIPCPKVRARVFRVISRSLRATGHALFVTQFRNSFYKSDRRNNSNSIRHLDGYIVRTKSGNFYYGLIPVDKIKKLAQRYNLSSVKAWTQKESAFVLVRSNPV